MSTVALTIDYSNGAQKHFSSIPWNKGLTILGVLQGATRIQPGIATAFGSDRSGHVLNLVIDGTPESGKQRTEWLIWVNNKPFLHRIGTDTSFGFNADERAVNLVNSGDHIVLKLSAVVPPPA